VRESTGLSFARLERVGETGEAATIRLTGFLKISDNTREVDLLKRFRRALGARYAGHFPDFDAKRLCDGKIVLELEHVGERTLESLMLSAVDGDSYVMRPLDVIDRVSAFIRCFSDHGLEERVADRVKEVVRAEVVQALINNSRKSGIHVRMNRDVTALASRMDFKPTVCHRDLSAANVVCTKDSIRLIDSRAEVPGAKISRSGVYGSSAIDCATFAVSLERKELERERLGLPVLGTVETFRLFVPSLISAGLFTGGMYDLCLACAYSVYAACACSYCMSPEKLWLYDAMKEPHARTLSALTYAGVVECVYVPFAPCNG